MELYGIKMLHFNPASELGKRKCMSICTTIPPLKTFLSGISTSILKIGRACPDDEKGNLMNIGFYVVSSLKCYLKSEAGTLASEWAPTHWIIAEHKAKNSCSSREQVESLCLKPLWRETRQCGAKWGVCTLKYFAGELPPFLTSWENRAVTSCDIALSPITLWGECKNNSEKLCN